MTKAIVGSILVGILFAASVAQFARRKTPASLLQLFGAGCLIVVVLTHIAEALHVFPQMRWGKPHSIGHYIDLTSAVLGIALLLGAWMFQANRPR